MIDKPTYWNKVYEAKGENAVSWFQSNPEPSLELIRRYAPDRLAAVIDIGGGASRLIDHLAANGFSSLTVLDISSEAIAIARHRIGDNAYAIKWINSDVTQWSSNDVYDVWHDRAVFHFLTDRHDQAAYIQSLKRALKAGGYLVIGTFALDGPEKCSGLPVMKHSPETLHNLFGKEFHLLYSQKHLHQTPSQSFQNFQYCVFQYLK